MQKGGPAVTFNVETEMIERKRDGQPAPRAGRSLVCCEEGLNVAQAASAFSLERCGSIKIFDIK